MQRAPARQDCEKMIVVLIVGLFATWICRQMMVMMVIVVVRVYGNFLVADSSHVNEIECWYWNSLSWIVILRSRSWFLWAHPLNWK